MAKIVEAIRPTAAQRIASEQRAIADVEREIAALEEQRGTALLADDPADAVKLGERIESAHRRLRVHGDRIAALQKQGRRETTDRRQQQKSEALASFEKQFADRDAAAVEVDRAIAAFSESLRRYRQACRAPFATWPDTFPPVRTYEGSSYSYVESRIASALRMQSPGAAHTLLTELGTRLGSLAEHDRAHVATLIEDIRTAPLPQLNKTDEAA